MLPSLEAARPKEVQKHPLSAVIDCYYNPDRPKLKFVEPLGNKLAEDRPASEPRADRARREADPARHKQGT